MAFEPIEELNEMLRRMSNAEGVRLLDAHGHMEDPIRNDCLDERWDYGDGAHLNAAGYLRLGRFLAEGVRDLLVPRKDGDIVKLLCLGDSITEGYPGHINARDEGNIWEPYTKQLEAPGREIVNLGLSGDTTMGMRSRFNTWVSCEKEMGHPMPDVCIVLGGTNDVFIGFLPEMVAENLRSIWGLCKKFRITPVAITLLPVNI